jgi:hypothetical protein
MLYKYKSKFVFNCEQNKKNIFIVEKLTSCFYPHIKDNTMTNRKKTNKDIQNAPQKTKDQTTWTPVTGGEAIKIIGLWHKKIFIAKSVSRHLLFNMRNNRRHQWSRTAYPSDLHGYYNAFKWGKTYIVFLWYQIYICMVNPTKHWDHKIILYWRFCAKPGEWEVMYVSIKRNWPQEYRVYYG